MYRFKKTENAIDDIICDLCKRSCLTCGDKDKTWKVFLHMKLEANWVWF